jgi:hypothetical protein
MVPPSTTSHMKKLDSFAPLGRTGTLLALVKSAAWQWPAKPHSQRAARCSSEVAHVGESTPGNIAISYDGNSSWPNMPELARTHRPPTNFPREGSRRPARLRLE